MSTLLNTLARGLRGAWWALDVTRRAVLNLLLLALLAAAAWALWRSGAPPLQPKTALVLDLTGAITEQRAGSGNSRGALRRLQGDGEAGTRLRDVLAVLEAAAKDPAITHALLLTDQLSGAGLPTLREVAAALQAFQAAGKPVIAWASGHDQRSYYLAAHATEVWLHPMGQVSIEGYGRLRSYYKDLFDRVGVSATVVRAGKFKNAGETYSASAPSPETLQSDAALYAALWSRWTGGVEAARKLPAGRVMQAVDSLPASLVAAGGDSAKWALQQGFVTALKTRDEMRAALIERGAKADDEPGTGSGRPASFRQVHWTDYLARLQRNEPALEADALGIVVAEGTIGDGRAGPGRIGGLSTADLIRQAREDRHVKALVLRVNSPGGSAFGSELVRRELELTRAAGKPVVVSMGDVAASGGYWISTAADEVLADAATITGSIGVIAIVPNAAGAFDKAGVHAAGSSTTWLGTAYDPRRALDPRFVQLVQAGVDHTYGDFIGRVAAARKRTPEQIDAVAQGRVWAGQDALGHGLVDRLGNLGDAVRAAAMRGKLAAGYRVRYIETPPGRLDRWLQRFGLSEALAPVAALLQGLRDVTAAGPGLAGHALAAALPEDLAWLAEQAAWTTVTGRAGAGGTAARQTPPGQALVHCLCGVP